MSIDTLLFNFVRGPMGGQPSVGSAAIDKSFRRITDGTDGMARHSRSVWRRRRED